MCALREDNMTFEQHLDSLQPPLTPDARATAIEWHEIRERRALCHRSALRDWSFEQMDRPKAVSNPTIIKDLTTRVAALEKMLEEKPSYTNNENKSSF